MVDVVVTVVVVDIVLGGGVCYLGVGGCFCSSSGGGDGGFNNPMIVIHEIQLLAKTSEISGKFRASLRGFTSYSKVGCDLWGYSGDGQIKMWKEWIDLANAIPGIEEAMSSAEMLE
ncbi:hypothetical protein MKW98_017255 [Papaver atlanticum]|uniref:Uncharacterized protein n=1 Tax=Papaver atlanticum TaxID=357466 RepID=A0AAD4X769_9MAGN|nr:hypothetical protein MKW98_017255 [Papaver atlanticum]